MHNFRCYCIMMNGILCTHTAWYQMTFYNDIQSCILSDDIIIIALQLCFLNSFSVLRFQVLFLMHLIIFIDTLLLILRAVSLKLWRLARTLYESSSCTKINTYNIVLLWQPSKTKRRIFIEFSKLALGCLC